MEPGTILLGKYRVDDVLGTGGMGRVVRAAHLYLQQPVAIKILLPHMAESAETVSRFLREAQSTVRLRSEHICRVTDVGTMTDGVPFMVMEYLEGNDLNQILRHHGPQLPQIVCDLMLQACEGMAEAHANGIVHRDIKPSNFFITRRTDGSMLLKILDFGISKTPVGVTELTGTQTVIGTPTYMSPEQMKSGRSADARSDVWSMGIVMYQLLVGRPPFSGDSYAELVLKVGAEDPAPLMVPLPSGLREVIMRCLEKDPASRHQSVAELARMLAPFASEPVPAAASAARTTRILQQKTGGHAGQPQEVMPLTAGGGRLTPLVTPRNWPPAAGSSTSRHGRGQVTHTQQVRGGRGRMLAGLFVLVAGAGAGGYIVSEARQSDAPTAEPPPPESPPPPPVAAKPAPPEPAVAKPEPAVAKVEPVVPKPEPAVAKPAPEPEPEPEAKPPEPVAKPKPVAKPAVKVAKPAVKPAAKPAVKPVAKPAVKPKPATKPKPKNTDLFDTRH